LECNANWHNSSLSLGKGIGFRKGFTPLALAHNKTLASTHWSIKVRPFAISAIMHQIPSELPMACSPKLGHNQEVNQEVKPAFRSMTSVELLGTFPDKFIQMLEEADLILSVNGREILKDILREIPPMPLTLTAQRLVLKRLEELPTNAPNEDEEEQYREIRDTAHDLFLPLMEAKSFEYAVEVAIKQSPKLRNSDLKHIIIELVRAGLLLNSSVKSYIEDKPMVTESGPFSFCSSEGIESAQFGANGERGQISLNTGIITCIIEHPSEQFSPFLRNLLQHNDVATFEGNIYEYVRSRRTILLGRAPGANQTTALALARGALLEKGVRVIPASEMIMKEATNQCHKLLKEKAWEVGLFRSGRNVPWKGVYSIS